MIYFSSVTKDFGNHKGIFDVSFEIKAGSITGFLGENGAGKTTTIKLLMGLLSPDEGEIFIMDRNLWEFDNYYTLKKYIGYLPNEDYLFSELTGRENLEYTSLLKTGDKNWYKKLEREIVYFQLQDDLDRPFKTYSTGMKKKLQLLASLVGYPPILIWDEPHNGLDVLSNIKIKEFLKNYISKDRTAFFSSHIIEMVENICDRVIIIHKGRIVSQIANPVKGCLTDIYLKATGE